MRKRKEEEEDVHGRARTRERDRVLNPLILHSIPYSLQAKGHIYTHSSPFFLFLPTVKHEKN
jgi:hypothetical protein